MSWKSLRAGALALCLLLPSHAAAQVRAGASTSSGTSRAFNPAISLNGLFLIAAYPDRPEHPDEGEAAEGHDHAHPEAGMDLQEVELRFSAEIDPYSKADATFAVHGSETHFEEVVITSRILGGGFGLRGGKFYLDATSENVLHTHEFPFVRRALINQLLFAEPYSDVGVELSYLFPLTPFVELKAVVVDGKDEGLFAVPVVDGGLRELEGSELVYNGALHTLFDLSESSTMGLSGRWTGGRNSLGTSTLSQVAGVSAQYRWIPTQTNRFRGLRVHGEYAWVDRASDDPTLGFDNSGWYGFARYRFARRWYLGARYGTLERSYDDATASFVDRGTKRATAQLAFVPSEFQALRVEYSYVDGPEASWSEIFLQLNFTIGSHPAHRY